MFQIELGKLQYKGQHAHYRYIEIVKILALLADNPNPPDFYGDTPIIIAAWDGHTEMVKILAPLTENPNAPDIVMEELQFLWQQRGWQRVGRQKLSNSWPL